MIEIHEAIFFCVLFNIGLSSATLFYILYYWEVLKRKLEVKRN